MELVINDGEREALLQGAALEAPTSALGISTDVVTEFAAGHGEPTTNEFLFFEPKRPPPYGMTRMALVAAKSRAVAAAVLLVGLMLAVVLVGMLSSWSTSMRWSTWFTLSTLAVLFAVMVLDLWDLSLTFFVATMALVLAGIITVEDALRL
jgi:hypothetical protein